MVWKPFFVQSRVPANPADFHIKPLAAAGSAGLSASARQCGLASVTLGGLERPARRRPHFLKHSERFRLSTRPYGESRAGRLPLLRL
jgi:hypothetical protein